MHPKFSNPIDVLGEELDRGETVNSEETLPKLPLRPKAKIKYEESETEEKASGKR